MGGRPQVSSGISSNMNRSNFQRSSQQDSDDEEGKYFFVLLQGLPSGFDIMYLALADRNVQVRFGLKVVWES